MTRPLDPATREALVERMRFYRDLGLTDFYRRPVDAALTTDADAPDPASEPLASSHHPAEVGAPGLASETWDSSPQPNFLAEEPAISARKGFSPPPQIAAAVPAAGRAAALQLIRDDIGDCTRCALHQGRNKLVFADGDPNARLMFVGEGPGADEDAQGLPFVGRAGQLLNNMIAAMGLRREQVFIANVVKCRPPGNRTPEPEEANTCLPFLFRQIDVVRPEVLVALGATAATYLLGARQPLAGLRGRVHSVRGARLIVTYHPAYLLRDPRQKKEAWADLQIAMRELGLEPSSRA
ncbi:MAG TPA: uracil-DNA glycosylase [Terracidiphilus sp.]|nr:uracil-DNA glycosylase [Terracidiphilus sp.]